MDPIRISNTIVEDSTHGGHDFQVRVEYVPTLDEHGNIAPDPYAKSDIAMGEHIGAFLNSRLPLGYGAFWKAEAMQAQGVVLLRIPILMGRHCYVINLRTTPLDKGVIDGANELLERYRLSRSRFHLSEFLEAREKYSALLDPRRQVPV